MKHKTALATAASITGVLLASATAFAATTGPDDNPSASDLTEETSSSTSSSTNPPVAPVVTQTTATPVSDAPIVYQLTGIADITLTRSGDNGLSLLGVVPAAGWTQSNHVRGEGIEVEFTSGTEKVEFKAWAVNGQIQTDIEREEIGPSSSGATKSSIDDRSSDDDSIDDSSYDDSDNQYDDSDSDDDHDSDDVSDDDDDDDDD